MQAKKRKTAKILERKRVEIQAVTAHQAEVQDHQAAAAAVVLVHDPQVVLHQIPGHHPVLLALQTLLDHHVPVAR
ncbi:hypothetical protein GHT06_021051 [Daphnia sinensis]|uniref:Uncharacterized protein n=1 Tax=Daphnia sinensis TaxID=1820382 RepID=A0AAD5L8S2_9CRUS|nr:hypothetical protein GHT06_021051 [Daphnia sinensis]